MRRLIGGTGKLWPDAVPIVWPQFTAGNDAASRLLYCRAVLGRHQAATGLPIADSTLHNTNSVGQFANTTSGCNCFVEFIHEPHHKHNRV